MKWLGMMILGSLFALTACSTTYRTADTHITQTTQAIKQAHEKSKHPSPAVITTSGYFISPEEVPIHATPSWMQSNVQLQAEKMPLNILLDHLLHDYSVAIDYDDRVQQTQPITLHYHGPLKGALNIISNQIHYHYLAEAHTLHWSTLETKTFDISFMPGASTYLVGQEQNQTQQGLTNAAGTPVNQIDDQQYSNLHGMLSVWQDLENTINQLKSADGHVVVSESTTSVTVSDHPSNVAAIQRYIQQLNERLSQQVAIKIQVLEVALSKDFNYGLNWNVLAHTLGTSFSLQGHAANATNLVNNTIFSNSNDSALTQLGVGSQGTDALIHALSQQGQVRVVTEPEVTTLNNQIAAIRITQSVGYIESVSQTSNQYFSTNSITPGSITDGFTLYLLPKIQNNNVFLQISSTIANLEKLEKVSTAPLEAGNTTHDHTQFQAIQVPTLAQKSFNQRSLVQSGSTLVVAGYKRLQDKTAQARFFGAASLGGQGASTQNIETLVLITPTILHSNHAHADPNA